MDVYISEEYVIRRREEKRMVRDRETRERTADRGDKEKRGKKWTAWIERERPVGAVSDDTVYDINFST